MIRMVVFDMAGTTVDEDNVVYKTLRKSINLSGFDFTLEQVLLAGAGREKLEAIRNILALEGIVNEPLAQEIFIRFMALLDVAYDTLPVFEQQNATGIFQKLRDNGILVVLNTGYNRQTAETLVAKIGWQQEKHFDLLVTASEVTQNRPEPDMILLAMKHFGITDPESVVKVGDSTVDVLEGRNAGCRINIGITTGAHDTGQLQTVSPEYIIGNLSELWPIISGELLPDYQ